ncbi:NACHT, LRR and PYD domains-containing protein 10 [Triplophysa tibetana]|uniref:NACHT, LRR and PYD domains-containing protein 10 n=1 Tax=Triplophysa tibetana TaxID=1572043 RepID=A0A5A9MXF3_9TELE|nr:NACHT, LRR and PYD domains-containing protein 10 [Triplophysa tibetana]
MSNTQTSTDGDSSPQSSSVHPKRSDPEPSCVSMKSDRSMNPPLKFKNDDTKPDLSSVHPKRSDPEPSCVSMKSDRSMNPPLKFNNDDTKPDLSSFHQKRSHPGVKGDVYKNHLKKFKSDDASPAVCRESEILKTFKSNLRKKFECLCEGISQERNPTLLNEIYTELHITESESGEISNEHEVRQIETQSRRTSTEDTPIKCNDIFKALPAQDKPIRRVLTKGVAGIGKTVSVQKFILDWAEGKENQDVHLIFPLPFREINLMKNQTLSLLDLLHRFFPETKEMEISSGKYKVLFIFDGLDECRVSLDFHSSVRLCDVSESASVDVILTNLMKGNLLPSALIWITSRPAAADLIPSECVDRVTEVRGFTDKQKEEYFSKRISDESLNNRIISHLKSSRSLYIMCHIPVFCWISATVLERMLSEAESEGEIPKTLTQMYTHFLMTQMNIKNKKYTIDADKEMIFKLGKLAFEQLVKGNLIFYDEDLRECGIDVAEASVYSGLCTQIFREELVLFQRKVYSFLHLTIQEHLAALYAHNSVINDKTQMFFGTFLQTSLSDLHQRAVDGALQCTNGHFDLFLRFLLGLSLESNQNILRGLMTQTVRCFHSNEKTVEYIKKKTNENPSPEKSINLFHCLNELGDHSLVEEIQHHLKSRTLNKAKLSSSQWSAVVFLLLTSEQKLQEFNIHDFVQDENKVEKLEVFQKMLPVIAESRSVQLSGCNITDEGCAALTSALRSNPSHLRDLDLSWNKVGDSGVKLICGVLENPLCKLETLKLCGCNITDEGCVALTSALRSNPSHLRHLDLTDNNVGDSGVKLICGVLENPHCKLETLKLCGCNITDEGCVALTSALRSNPSHLRHLDLTDNNVGDSGVKLICGVLENPHCKLETLKLSKCNITDEGCVALTSALRSNPSHLRHLDLSWNKVGDSGVKLICVVLENPLCKLETLTLCGCNITDEGCAALSSALRSNPSHLRHLDLTDNNVGDSGVKLISTLLENPLCKLELLKLERCNITDEGCVALTSPMRSNPSQLRHLDLSGNNVGDSVVKLICDVLENPLCQLENLTLWRCNITTKGCADLISALRSNPSHLTHLRLCDNDLRDSGVKLISKVLEDPQCKLEFLRLWTSNITAEGCVALSSAMRSNPSQLRELDLCNNKIGDSGVKLICDVLKNPLCKLEKLMLSQGNITDEGCVALTSALRSNPSHLRHLMLSMNYVGDSGVKLICDVLKDPHCKLEILELMRCNITDEGCVALTSALRSNPSHLRHLDLSGNSVRDSGVKLISDLKDDPQYKLEKVMIDPPVTYDSFRMWPGFHSITDLINPFTL